MVLKGPRERIGAFIVSSADFFRGRVLSVMQNRLTGPRVDIDLAAQFFGKALASSIFNCFSISGTEWNARDF
jgi:hypothetical protein